MLEKKTMTIDFLTERYQILTSFTKTPPSCVSLLILTPKHPSPPSEPFIVAAEIKISAIEMKALAIETIASSSEIKASAFEIVTSSSEMEASAIETLFLVKETNALATEILPPVIEIISSATEMKISVREIKRLARSNRFSIRSKTPSRPEKDVGGAKLFAANSYFQIFRLGKVSNASQKKTRSV